MESPQPSPCQSGSGWSRARARLPPKSRRSRKKHSHRSRRSFLMRISMALGCEPVGGRLTKKEVHAVRPSSSKPSGRSPQPKPRAKAGFSISRTTPATMMRSDQRRSRMARSWRNSPSSSQRCSVRARRLTKLGGMSPDEIKGPLKNQLFIQVHGGYVIGVLQHDQLLFLRTK
jgi:hypothetical protein